MVCTWLVLVYMSKFCWYPKHHSQKPVEYLPTLHQVWSGSWFWPYYRASWQTVRSSAYWFWHLQWTQVCCLLSSWLTWWSEGTWWQWSSGGTLLRIFGLPVEGSDVKSFSCVVYTFPCNFLGLQNFFFGCWHHFHGRFFYLILVYHFILGHIQLYPLYLKLEIVPAILYIWSTVIIIDLLT